VYLFHRYQTEATVKLIGGVDYAYSMRGDGQPGPKIVGAQVQHAALEAMLRTLDPAVLALPEHLLDLIPPNPIGVPDTREQFRGYTTPVTDPVAMAEMAADHSASLILNAQRASRLVNQSARGSGNPGLDTVIDAVLGSTILDGRQEGYNGLIQRAVNMAVLRNLILLAGNAGAAPDARAVAGLKLNELGTELVRRQSSARESVWKAHYSYLAGLIEQFKKEPLTFSAPSAPYTPPGAPIGSGEAPVLHLRCDF
jgi:hypothetical protein